MDHHQLPTIGTNGDDSPAFHFENKFELKIKMRQDDESHIANLCDDICNHIDTDHDLSFIDEIKTQFDTSIGKGYSLSNMNSCVSSFIRNYNDGNDVIMTAFRRKSVDDINKTIRSMLWEGEDHNQFVVDESIVMDDQFSINNVVYAYTGQRFKVKSIREETIKGIHCDTLEVYNTTIEMAVFLPVVSKKGLQKYNKTLNELKEEANRTRKWHEFMEFKKAFAYVSYGYCLTNYKIQGQTVKGCYVYVSDILAVKPITKRQKLQSLYVGCSRPTDFLALF